MQLARSSHTACPSRAQRGTLLAQREHHREHVGTPDPGSLTDSQSGARLKEGFRVAFKSQSRRISCHLMLMYFNFYALFYIEILRSSAGGQPGLKRMLGASGQMMNI